MMAMRCLAILFAPRTKVLEDSIPNIMKLVPVSSIVYMDLVLICYAYLQARLACACQFIYLYWC